MPDETFKAQLDRAEYDGLVEALELMRRERDQWRERAMASAERLQLIRRVIVDGVREEDRT